MSLYRDFAGRLLDTGKAYRCFCKPDDLKAKRELAERDKRPARYEGTCRKLPAEAARARAEARERFAVRFAVEPGRTTVKDLVRGDV